MATWRSRRGYPDDFVSELPEIIGMSDRVLVMHDGALAGMLSRQELTAASIMHLATGGAIRP